MFPDSIADARAPKSWLRCCQTPLAPAVPTLETDMILILLMGDAACGRSSSAERHGGATSRSLGIGSERLEPGIRSSREAVGEVPESSRGEGVPPPFASRSWARMLNRHIFANPTSVMSQLPASCIREVVHTNSYNSSRDNLVVELPELAVMLAGWAVRSDQHHAPEPEPWILTLVHVGLKHLARVVLRNREFSR